MKRIKNLPYKLLITGVVFFCILLMFIFQIPCPVLKFTGYHCPGCGMSRALISALKFNFSAAFEYHKMFWTIPFLYLAFLFDGKIFKNRWLNVVFYVIIAVGFLVNWLY